MDSQEVGGFLDRTLDEEKRRHVADHLTRCDRCREEFVEVGRVVQLVDDSPRKRWIAVTLGAAAALILIVLQPWNVGDSTPTSRFRDGVGSAARPAVEVVRPADRTRLSRDAGFVWRSVDADAVYRFTLVSENGQEVYSTTTSDTTITLPEEVSLAGGEFYWVVDALLPDGRTASTGAYRFRTTP